MTDTTELKSEKAVGLKSFLDARSITMLFLGFSAGLPLFLIFSSLSLWLREAGVSRTEVTYFSWAALGFSFKFIWAPLVDKLPIPFLTKKFGRRRSWLLLAQTLIIFSIIWMSLIDPANSEHALTYMAFAVTLLGFSAATQDIAIDAFRIESAPIKMQAILSATYIAGYRVGMIASGAGALFFAESFGSSKELYSYTAWHWTYLIMASLMGVGLITTLLRPEPVISVPSKHSYQTRDYVSLFLLFLVIVVCFITGYMITSGLDASATKTLTELFHNKHLAGFVVGAIRLVFALGFGFVVILGIKKANIVNTDMVEESYIAPVKDFFETHGKSLSLLLLLLIGTYRISDIVLGVISNVFYQDMGFTKTEIAAIVKTFGLVMTILGGFIGGYFTMKFGVIRMLFWGALLSAGTNLLFLLLSTMGDNLFMLYFVISADNLSAGLASAAFVAFLSSLTNISFTAVQYAIFTSLMTLLPKIMGGYSGTMVDVMGYEAFFTFTTIIGIPVLYLVWICGKKFKLKEE